ncbi:MAG: RagB/SusD family nutrient uptake outer membrane protein [Saprospiraceae bacterium]|nr:RagB/SusD family nutrient uptake outer membrane protein [Saprospiraceae bacterium]
MKNLIIYIFLTIGLTLFLSCADQLEIEPTLSISDTAALTSEENVKKLLIGTYQIEGSRNSHGGYIQIFSDLLGIDDQVSWNGTFSEPREALTKTMFATNFIVRTVWSNQYTIINQSNLVLDNLHIITDEGEKERVEGEARFLRAFHYFELVRLFGNEQKGVPIRLNAIADFGGDLTIKRNTTSEVYSLILDDINTAISLLPEENGVYANKYAALALLARVQLYLGNYKAAGDAAHEVISDSGNSLASTYSNAFNNDANGPEDIYAMQVTAQSGENQMIQMYASQGNGGRGGDISINQSYLDIFDDPNDVRASFYYENERGDLLTNKYINQFGNVPIFRLAEMILIRAESNQRLNTSTGAAPLEDINALRERSVATPLTTVNLDDILIERQRELAFEGFAIYDIKRTQSSVTGLPYNSPKLVMPIPQSEMDANSLMEQNEGY